MATLADTKSCSGLRPGASAALHGLNGAPGPCASSGLSMDLQRIQHKMHIHNIYKNIAINN